MDYAQPIKLVEQLIAAGKNKASLSVRDMLLRGFLSGALLGYATALAFKVSDGFTGGAAALVAGVIFPVGFVMIVLLGLELVTGSFALLPMSAADGKINSREMLRNWGWVFLGNLLGSLLFGALLVITLGGASASPGALADKIIMVAQAKTLAYQHAGSMGWLTAFTKGILCNWMVTLGVVLGMISTSTIGKIVAPWLPIMTFFALGFEHSVVNMFVIPTAMLLGADISVYQWWFWNQIPVTLGNLVGGTVFTGMLLYATYGSSHTEQRCKPAARKSLLQYYSKPRSANDKHPIPATMK